MKLAEHFPQELELFTKLFSKSSTTPELKNLNELYLFAEEKWEENICRLQAKNSQIKYLFIGEAAPSADSRKTSNYFYGEQSKGPWWNAPTGAFQIMTSNKQAALDKLAEKHFLLIDTMPFAAKFTTSLRSSKKEFRQAYLELVSLCASTYFKNKLCDPRLTWDPDVKVAFSVMYHAKAIITALPQGLCLPTGQILSLSEDLLATDASNSPSANRLRTVFQLSL